MARDYPENTPARRKALRQAHPHTIAMSDIEAVRFRSVQTTMELENELRLRKEAILAEYRSSKEYQDDIVELLKPEIQQALSQVHDYRQFVAQIIQNVNVILETRSPNETHEQQLEKGSHEEQAIYWAARLMETKIEAALFLMYPERITDFRSIRRFRVHGLVTKYRKIYQRAYEQKDLQTVMEGVSYGEIVANPDAVGVIPHTFLDNALKYAPRGSQVILSFDEDEYDIRFSVKSLGPYIERDERKHVFDLFFRGAAARQMQAEGTGFGLALAQRVASAIGAHLAVKQESDPSSQPYYWTTFTVQLQKPSK